MVQESRFEVSESLLRQRFTVAKRVLVWKPRENPGGDVWVLQFSRTVEPNGTLEQSRSHFQRMQFWMFLCAALFLK